MLKLLKKILKLPILALLDGWREKVSRWQKGHGPNLPPKGGL